MQYPVTVDQVISSDSLAAGTDYKTIHYKDYLRELNAAFYTGFLMATCKSKAEYNALDVMDRISVISRAIATAEEFYSEETKSGHLSDLPQPGPHQKHKKGFLLWTKISASFQTKNFLSFLNPHR